MGWLGLQEISLERIQKRFDEKRRTQIDESIRNHPIVKELEQEDDAAIAALRHETAEALKALDAERVSQLQSLDAPVAAAMKVRDGHKEQLKRSEAALAEAERRRFLASNGFSIRRDRLEAKLRETASSKIDEFLSELFDAEQETCSTVPTKWTEETGEFWRRTGKSVFKKCTNIEDIARRAAAIRAGRKMVQSLRMEDYGDAAGLDRRLSEIQNEIENMADVPATPVMEA